MIIPNHNYTPRERTVCDLLAPLGKVRHLLNIGMRRPDDPRNLWWINICQASGTETHVLEVFEPNCQELRAAGIVNVTCGNVRDVSTIFEQPFDVILWWHGPEHLDRTELPAVFDNLWRLTAETLIVGCPLGDEPQGICYGNHHERHLSCWQPAELAALGFETSVVRDERPYPHITAWRSRKGVGDRLQGTDSVGNAVPDVPMSAEFGTPSAERADEGSVQGTGLTCQEDTVNVPPLTTHPSQLALPAAENWELTPGHPRSGSARLVPSSFRTAIIFDDKARPETTGVYCRAALRSLVDVEFFHPDDLAQLNHERAPRSGFDLYLAIDDGLDYPWPGDLHPCAFWAIDTHMDFERCLHRADQFDFVFAAQRDGAERLRQAGVRSAQWLPLACDPIFHGKQDVPTQYDVCFVGNLFPGPRIDLVRLIQQYFRHAFVGNAYFEEMARVYSASKIVFNRSLRNDVNMRVFEALASGSLLVTNDLSENGQRELFRDGVHLVTYSDGDELLDKLRFYLRHDELRERIAAAGRAEVLAKHTYRQRMEEILSVVGKNGRQEPKSEQLKVQSAEGGAGPAHGCPDAERAEVTWVGSSASPYHDPSYFNFARPEVMTWVPMTARTVLEIGCGHGRLGEALKARQGCEVVGVELDGQAAEVARCRQDRVFQGDIESMKIDQWGGYFDAVIAADVLEHFADPAKQLRRIRDWLRPDGVVIASIPNLRHASVVKSLLDGNWTYEVAGLLDNTHLWFFTRRNIQKLFEEAGYSVTSWAHVPGPGYEEWVQQGRPLNIDLGRIQLTGLPEQEAEEFFIYQWLVVATAKTIIPSAGREADAEGPVREVGREEEALPSSGLLIPTVAAPAVEAGGQPAVLEATGKGVNRYMSPDRLPSCLLLLITYNRLDYTRLSVESVLALDYPDLQIVIWDNASTDGTVDFLKQRLAGVSRARLIISSVNRGVVYPMNAVWCSELGGEVSPGAGREELLVKVDNDTWVPPDLLRRLAECHQRSKRFGVLSGFHFRAEGEALAVDSRVSELDGVRVLSQPYVGGCAVMVRREVLDRLGPIPFRSDGQQAPFMDSGWTFYQQKMNDEGLVNGYPWPPIHVDHMEDVRSPRCIRSAEHQEYKQALRGMSLEQFTEDLCVWRPIWTESAAENANGIGKVAEAVPLSPHALSVRNERSPVQGNGHTGHPPLESNGQGSRPEFTGRHAGRLRFTQDFAKDFDQFDFRGSPFAFVRFADGERAICAGQPIKGTDGWNYAGGSSPFRDALLAALRYADPDYYIGISDGCCDAEAKTWYLREITVPLSQVTFSNIFVNGNYGRFRQLDRSNVATVSCEGGDFWVPEDVVNTRFDIDLLVERLLSVHRTILVSAGPAACVIIHRYWLRASAQQRQVIVDVGSAIDEWTKGRKTRQYQVPGTRNAELVCTW